MCRRDIRKHLTFVNSNYNILLTLSLKLLIQYQLSQREAFFRRDAYLPFFIVEFFQQKVKKMRTVIIFENLLSKTWPSCWSSNLIGAYQSLFFSSEMERLKLEINQIKKDCWNVAADLFKEILLSGAIWLHFPISIRFHSTPCGPKCPNLRYCEIYLSFFPASNIKTPAVPLY